MDFRESLEKQFLFGNYNLSNRASLAKKNQRKIEIFSYPSVLTCVLGEQQEHSLNETVLLSTHNICFG